jgi:hypothetical protein
VVRRAAFEKPPPWPIDEFVAMQDADRDSVESPRAPPLPSPAPSPTLLPFRPAPGHATPGCGRVDGRPNDTSRINWRGLINAGFKVRG